MSLTLFPSSSSFFQGKKTKEREKDERGKNRDVVFCESNLSKKCIAGRRREGRHTICFPSFSLSLSISLSILLSLSFSHFSGHIIKMDNWREKERCKLSSWKLFQNQNFMNYEYLNMKEKDDDDVFIFFPDPWNMKMNLLSPSIFSLSLLTRHSLVSLMKNEFLEHRKRWLFLSQRWR